jgi:hypothetical protein
VAVSFRALPSRLLRLLAPVACGAALIFVAGCGRTDEEKVRDTVDQYVKALDGKDYQKVCDLFDESFRRDQGLVANCAQTLASQDTGRPGGDSTIASVKVRQGKATVALDVSQGGEAPSRRTISLVRRDGDWKISGTT